MTNPATALMGAFGLPGTKLSPDLEQIIGSPIMDKAISYVARKDKLGPNPILKYISEQMGHAIWHLDDMTWGSSKPFLWRRTESHPELRYDSPIQLLKASRNYLATMGISIPYNLRSIFFGTDSFGMGPTCPPLSELSNWQKIKVSLAALGEVPGYFMKVGNKIVFDARKMKAANQARDNLRDMSRTRILPQALNETRRVVIPFVKSFDDIIITPPEQKLDGKSIVDLSREGGVWFHGNHPSLVQLALDFYVFEKLGIDNVITIAGSNLINGMKDRGYARKLELLLRNSGVLFFDRKKDDIKSKPYLYNISLEEFAGYQLASPFNVRQFSNGGREKLTNEPDSRTTLELAVRKAKYIVVIAYAFDKIFDDHALAYVDKKTPPGTFEDLAKMKGSGGGRVFVTIGELMSSAHYFEKLTEIKDAKEQEKMLKIIRNEIDADLSLALKKLTTFTSTYILAEAIKQSKMQKFSFSDVLGNAYNIVKYARDYKFPLPPELKTGYGALFDEMKKAGGILVERGAMSRLGEEEFLILERQRPLLNFYSAKIEPALALAKK
jgi:hypothetical protein